VAGQRKAEFGYFASEKEEAKLSSQMICVLSSLSFRRLLAIQSRTLSRQLAKRLIASWHEATGTLIYSCVSLERTQHPSASPPMPPLVHLIYLLVSQYSRYQP